MRHVDLKLETELRRGIFQLAVLSLLVEPRYGYQIARLLADHGLAVEEGTLYPLLRRMEEQGLLESWWVTENVRPRKYYRTTEDGTKSLGLLLETWGRVDAALRGILQASKPGASGDGDPAAGRPPAGDGASTKDPAGPGGEGASDG